MSIRKALFRIDKRMKMKNPRAKYRSSRSMAKCRMMERNHRSMKRKIKRKIQKISRSSLKSLTKPDKIPK